MLLRDFVTITQNKVESAGGDVDAGRKVRLRIRQNEIVSIGVAELVCIDT